MYQRSDSAYESVRAQAVWNAIVPDRRPDRIARPTSAAEIAELVRDARARADRIAIKSGGHNWRGACLRDGGLLLDLGAMKRVDVDAEARMAVVQPGATHMDLAHAIVPHGLGFPIGHCETVGLGGYLLAGGYGWNPREWGPACWSVEAVDIVTVDGEQRRIDAEHDPELFWAARGGGSGFPAFTTAYHLRLKPLPAIATRRVHFPLDDLPALLAWSAGVEQMDPGLEISLIAHRIADGPSGRADEPVTTVQATAFAPTQERAGELLLEALAGASQISKPLAPARTVEVQLNALEAEAAWVHGRRYCVDMCWVADSYEELGELCRSAIEDAPSKLTRIVFAWGFAPDGGPDVAQTLHGTLTINVYAIWEHPDGDDANERWTADVMKAMEPRITGFYAGESDLSVDPQRKVRAYPPEMWERLQRVRDTYDPQRVKHGFISEE